MSSVKYYRDLLTQRERIEAFRRAIRKVVRPGDRVLEVGTGLGTFAFFAADAGAAEVWAVEGAPVVHVARTIARLNGYEGRIEFIRGWIPHVELPGKADVIIFEDFAPRLIDVRIVRLLSQLRDCFVAEGARFLPESADLFVAPVSSSDLWREVAPIADESTAYGIDWTPSREYVANAALPATVPSAALAATARCIGHVEFGRPVSSGEMDGTAEWILERDTVVHGLAYWFDLHLGGGERLSNAPGASPASWGQLLLPADPPLEVGAGSQLTAAVRHDALADGIPGWLAWEIAAEGEVRRGHEFAAEPASLGDVAVATPDGVPTLDRRGRLEAAVLNLVDGRRSVGEIAAELVAREDGLTRSEAERLVVRLVSDKIKKVELAHPVVRAVAHDPTESA